MNTKNPLSLKERTDKFLRWLRWSWWEVLIVVLVLLMLHWFLISIDRITMTVTENGTLISDIQPTVRGNDYWSGGSYLSGPATRLPTVSCSREATVELAFKLLPPNRTKVEVFTVYDMDTPMFHPNVCSETREIESSFRSGTLTFSLDGSEAPHQVIVATAVWYGILGKQEMNYVFHLASG